MLEVRAGMHEGRPVNCALSSNGNQKWNVVKDFNKTLLFILFHGNRIRHSGVSTYRQTAQWLVAVLEVLVASATKIFKTMILRFFGPGTLYIWGCLRMFYRLLRPVYVKTLKCKWNFTCSFICAWNFSHITQINELGGIFGPKGDENYLSRRSIGCTLLSDIARVIESRMIMRQT